MTILEPNIHYLIHKHEFDHPLILCLPIQSGLNSALLRTAELISGRPIEDNPKSGSYKSKRVLRIILQFTEVKGDTPKAEFKVYTRDAHWFSWPMPGQSIAVLVETKAIKINGKRGCSIIAIERVDTIGRII